MVPRLRLRSRSVRVWRPSSSVFVWWTHSGHRGRIRVSEFMEWGSIDLDTCNPENTCPLRDFDLQETCKFVRSYIGGFKTEACQALLHLRRRNGRSDFSVE